MLPWLAEPLASEIVQRALVGGLITAGLCAIVGTWVVLRGAAFLGDAMSHAVLPGVTIASLLSGNLFVGAMIAALAMAYGVSALGGSSRLSADTTIGLLLVGMLALGVIIVSHSQSYAVDLTGFLFGDVLAVTQSDIAVLVGALAMTAVAAFVGRRAFVAATFDGRKAATLGLRPELAAVALTVLMAVAIVASFNVVGTLLVFGLLIAPPAAAMVWANTITGIMTVAALIGASSVVLGLLVSWHAGTAGGATIAAVAVAIFFCSMAAVAIGRRVVRHGAWLATLLVVTACADTPVQAPPPVDEHDNPPANAQESDEPVSRLILVEPATGATAVLDIVGETQTPLGESGQLQAVDERGMVRAVPGDCKDVIDAVTTNRAVYFGCANGAIHVDVSAEPPVATPIPYPRPAAALGRLRHPDLDDALARIAGDEVWVLDSGRRNWSSVQMAGAVAANTGDDGEVLVLTRDGVLHAVDTATGTQTSAVELFAGGIPVDKPSPVIEVDSDRAYVNNAAGRVVYEIDYGAALRVARTLHTEIEPGLMVEAGR